MKLALRMIAMTLTAALTPFVSPTPSFAESKTARPIPVTVTIPVMLRIAPAAARKTEKTAPKALERRPISLNSSSDEALTNDDAYLTREWRRSPEGRLYKLYTCVTR